MTREEQIYDIAREYHKSKWEIPYSLQMRVGFIEGAKWADVSMINKICEWLETIDFEMEYMGSDDDGYTFFDEEKFINDFRKTMEE